MNNITERVKTFDDAVRELGKANPLVQAYYNNALFDTDKDNSKAVSDIIAYLKLRIIVAVLNEGWTPRFTENEDRYSPYFDLFSNRELDAMDIEQRQGIRYFIMGDASNNELAYAGMSYAYVNSYYTNINTTSSYHLSFKSRELAEYAGAQFIDIYAQMMGFQLR